MERTHVESSNLESIGYDEHSNTLEVQFKRGAIYRYDGVPHSVWVHFLNAPSKGSYFSANIKNAYPATKVQS